MIKYYYIDDDHNAAKNFIRGFSQNGIEVVEITINNFEEAINSIIGKKDIDGIILDHKLEEFITEGGTHLNFRGTSIAQEIRNRQKSTEQAYTLKDFPVVLLSATDNIVKSLDNTGKDLFDLIISKDELNNALYLENIENLKSCYNAYLKINETRNLDKILGNDIKNIDFRFSDYYETNLKLKPTHEVAMFLLKELILKKGVLINESVLAARLGVNITNSADWTNLKKELKNTEYSGIYSSSHERWWMPLVEQWWKSISKENLKSLSSKDRIKIIKEKYNFSDLNEIELLPRAKSRYFWTICYGSLQPIDEIDGVVIANQTNLYTWQEVEYVSINEALTRENINRWRNLSPIGKIQIDELIETINNEQK